MPLNWFWTWVWEIGFFCLFFCFHSVLLLSPVMCSSSLWNRKWYQCNSILSMLFCLWKFLSYGFTYVSDSVETSLNHFYSLEHPSLSSLHKDESFPFGISQIFGAFLQNGFVMIMISVFFFLISIFILLKNPFSSLSSFTKWQDFTMGVIRGQCCQLLRDYKLLEWALLFISLGYDSKGVGSQRRENRKEVMSK